MKSTKVTGILITILLFIGCQTTSAEKKGLDNSALKTFHPTESSLSHLQSNGLIETGLKPIYSSKTNCPKISSFFASRTRGDGSIRHSRFFHGYHGGIDIPAPEGTPVLAVADGTVVDKKVGKFIGGIELILQHSPDNTGLDVWLYSQYKHLKEMPALKIGENVNVGETIALAGRTGTRGGHYGDKGHSHLHLTTFVSPTNEYRAMKVFLPMNGKWVDPLSIFLGKPLDSHSIRSLPEKDKKVIIPYITKDGNKVPESSRIIWPFYCTSH